MRIDERLAAGSEPSFSFEFFPPQTDEGERNLGRALAELSRLEPDVRVGHLRRGREHDGEAQDGRHRRPPQARLRHGGDGALHLRRRRPSTSCARRSTTMRDAGIDNVLALRGDPPQRRRRRGPRRRAACRYSRELIELIRDEYDFAIGAACFPEVHIHADGRRERPALPQGEGRRRRALPDHAALLRQRRPTTTSSRGRATSGIDVPIIPGIMPITDLGPDQADHGDVRRHASRPAAARARAARATSPAPCPTSASPTPRCSAPTCWPTARPGIHFYTLNRSPATRAILSALRLLAPWRRAVPA